MKEKIAARQISTVMMGSSAAMSAGTRGVSSGAARRSEVMRAAMPTDPLMTLAR